LEAADAAQLSDHLQNCCRPNAPITLVGAQSEAMPYANIAGIPAFIELRDAYVSGEILNDESKATVR